MKLGLLLASALTVSFCLAGPAAARSGPGGGGADGDGLADFHEVHKYRTDPAKKDTAGRGVPDGNWRQRREFTYSARAVLRLMPPYSLRAMTDDYQDARLRKETKDYAEVEVVVYPLNTNADALTANPTWKKDYAGMKEYLAPGVSTNWDARMRKDLLAELARAGIHPDRLTDREVVEQVSRWLYRRSTYRAMFSTHFVHFAGGKPAVYPGLEAAFARGKGSPDWTDRQQFEHELLGKEMFYHRTHGSCTSAAVCQATVLRALGIPTRLIVAVPVADPSDPEQVARVRKGLTHHGVRHAALLGLLAAGNSYTNHTFLEVFVGRRWRRLNYTKLGQNVLDPAYLGLMVHVHTFNDLSEAGLAPTWGARYGLGRRGGEFTHSNPYRLVVLDDYFGLYAKVSNPPPKEHKHITITRAYWAEAADTPEQLRRSAAGHSARDGAVRLFIHGDEWWDNAGDYLQYRVFLQRVDRRLVFRAKGHPDVKGEVMLSFFTNGRTGLREIEVAIPAAEYAKMVKGVPYTLHPVNGVAGYRWRVKPGLTVSRQASLEERLGQVLERLDRLERRVEALEKKR
jgi:hypothetical protein